MEFRLSAAEEAFRAEVRDWLARQSAARLGHAGAIASRARRRRRSPRRKALAGDAAPRRLGRASPGRASTAGAARRWSSSSSSTRSAPRRTRRDSINLAVALGLVGPTLIACGTAGAAGALPAAASCAARTSGARASPSPNAGSDLAGAEDARRGATATRSSSPGRRSGPASPSTPTGASSSCAPTRARRASTTGLTFLLVDMHSPGITIRPLVEMTGEAWFNEVFFDDVRVPRANVVGEIDSGWDVVLTTLAHERGGAAPHARLRRELHALVALARRARDGGAGRAPTARPPAARAARRRGAARPADRLPQRHRSSSAPAGRARKARSSSSSGASSSSA